MGLERPSTASEGFGRVIGRPCQAEGTEVHNGGMGDEVRQPDGWNDLLSRAEGCLDEQGVAEYAKRKAASERKAARRRELTGSAKPPYDWWMVKSVLVEYDRCGRFAEAVRACGGREAEVLEAKRWSAEIGLVYDFVWERLRERMRLRARDIAMSAQDGLERAVTDDECKLSVKALELALERTVPELYGDPGKLNGGGRGSGAQVVYNLPGLTLNLITPPKGLLGAKCAESEVVDVEA